MYPLVVNLLLAISTSHMPSDVTVRQIKLGDTSPIVVTALQDGLITPLSAELARKVSKSVVGVRIGRVVIGTAVIISNNGFALTTGDIAFEADGNPKTGLSVSFEDGNSAYASVNAYDPVTDLALLRIENLPTKSAVAVNLSKNEPSEVVLAYVTQGAVRSSVTRKSLVGVMSSSRRFMPLFEVRLESGWGIINSAPLFDTDGSLVGLLMASLSNIDQGKDKDAVKQPNIARDFAGSLHNVGPRQPVVAYSLSTKALNRVVQGLLTKGFVSHPWIGVYFTNASPNGAFVSGLVLNGPAAKGGLMEGDVIFYANQTPIKTQLDLASFLFEREVNERIVLRVKRGGSELALTVTIQNDPNSTSKSLKRVF